METIKNLQSAQDAYKQLERVDEQLKTQGNTIEAANERLKAVENALDGKSTQIELDKALNRIKELENENAQLYEINNKLFIKAGAVVDEKPYSDPITEEERQQEIAMKEVEDKLKVQHDQELKQQLERLKENEKWQL